MGGISSTESNFNNTFAAVDWSSVITTGLRTAGEGMKDGMESSILGSDAGTSSVRAASTIPNAAGLADILLNIDFDRFTDTISGVCIEEGSLIFEIKADYETIEDSQKTIFELSGYSISSVADLKMTASGSDNAITISINNVAGAIEGTVKASADSSSGTVVIKDIETVSNIYIDLNDSTGGTVVTESGEYEIDEILDPSNTPVQPARESKENPYTISGIEDVIAFPDKLEGKTGTVYFELVNDIAVPVEGKNSVFTIPEGADVYFDLGGHVMAKDTVEYDNSEPKTVGDRSFGGYIFSIWGNLTVADGQIGGRLYDNPNNRLMELYTGARLSLDWVKACCLSSSGGPAIYVDKDTTVNINNSTLYSSTYVVNAEAAEGANVTIRNSTIASIASNALSNYKSEGQLSDDGSAFAYAISSNCNIDIDSTSVYGIQGAISLNGGTSLLGKDVYAYSGPDVFEIDDVMREDFKDFNMNWLITSRSEFEVLPGEIYCAVYVAGERSEVNKAFINGGVYVSDSPKATIRVGNNEDGGLGKAAYCVINDGTFECKSEEGKVAFSEDLTEGSYGYGKLQICGGRFKDLQADTEQALATFVDPESYQITEEGGYFIVAPIE